MMRAGGASWACWRCCSSSSPPGPWRWRPSASCSRSRSVSSPPRSSPARCWRSAPASARGGGRDRARARRAGGRTRGGRADRRPRHRGARSSRRRARRNREPGGEFFRRRGGARAVDGDRRPAGRRDLQGDQHRRQHDRPSHAAPHGVRLGGRAARRSRQPPGVASVGRAARRRSRARRSRCSRRRVVHGAARRASPPITQCGLSRGRDGGRPRPRARRPACLRRRGWRMR